MSVNPEKQSRFPFALRKARRFGLTAALVVGGLLALDVAAFAATLVFGAEILEAAKAAGVEELLPQ